MSDYIVNLPAFPEYDDYLLVQYTSGKYLLLCFDNGGSLTISDNGIVQDSGGYHYTLSSDGDCWESDGVCGGAHPFTYDGCKPVFSTVDCYSTSGSLLYSGSSYVAPVSFLGGMSSSDMIFSFLGDVRCLIPIIIVATVAVVGIRKALGSLFGLIRGA